MRTETSTTPTRIQPDPLPGDLLPGDLIRDWGRERTVLRTEPIPDRSPESVTVFFEDGPAFEGLPNFLNVQADQPVTAWRT